MIDVEANRAAHSRMPNGTILLHGRSPSCYRRPCLFAPPLEVIIFDRCLRLKMVNAVNWLFLYILRRVGTM